MADDEYDPEDIRKHLPPIEPRKVEMNPDNVTCNKCGWVSFAVSREFAEAEIAKFNAYYDALSLQDKASYGGRSTLASYACLRCGGSDFRPAVDGDVPDGCTLNPVVCDKYAGILERFAANADELVADIWKAVCAQHHGAVVSWMDFEHLVDDELSTLHIIAIFDRLAREGRLYQLDRLNYWTVSLDGKPPDLHVIAAMFAKRKGEGLGAFELTDDGVRYRWSGHDLRTGIGGAVIEFVHDALVAKGLAN